VKCAGCCRIISPRDLVRRAAGDVVYHVDCFACVVCGRQLGTGDALYALSDGRLVCRVDWLRGAVPAALVDQQPNDGMTPQYFSFIVSAPDDRLSRNFSRISIGEYHFCTKIMDRAFIINCSVTPKMHQIRFWAGTLPQTFCVSLQLSPGCSREHHLTTDGHRGIYHFSVSRPCVLVAWAVYQMTTKPAKNSGDRKDQRFWHRKITETYA